MSAHRSAVPLLVALVAVIAGISLLRVVNRSSGASGTSHALSVGCAQASSSFHHHQSQIWLTASGRVIRLLPDETGARTHQRFVISCSSGQTLLVVNDISIGRRVPVGLGAEVGVRGEYVWNAQGGLIHFTHHAAGGGQGGWILYHHVLYSVVVSVPYRNEAIEQAVALPGPAPLAPIPSVTMLEENAFRLPG